MKKVLAVLLAALMMFTTLGMFGYAETPVVGDKFTLDDALNIAKGYADADGSTTIPTVLVFNTGAADIGTVPMGNQYYINDGRNKYSYVIVDSNFNVGSYVQLPYIKNAGDGMSANWLVQSGPDAGRTFAQGSLYEIPDEMLALPQSSNYIVFYAQLVPNETTPVIEKILNIFYKVVKVIFGPELALKLAGLVKEFGIVITE